MPKNTSRYGISSQYHPNVNRDIHINDACAAIEKVLKLPFRDRPQLIRKMLNAIIWFITQVDGKYGTKYKSEQAIDLSQTVEIEHEHVFTKKSIINELLALPLDCNLSNAIRSIVASKCIACIVSKEEHKRLKKGVEGWNRYCGIVRVFDTSNSTPVKYL